MKVLVAEDDPVTCRILEKLIVSWGFAVDVVSDGQSALEKLIAPDPPQIAILDWMMPHFTGIEVCKQLKSRQEDCDSYCIILTGKTDKDSIVEGLTEGADDYLTKPIEKEILRARLQTGARLMKWKGDLKRLNLSLDRQVKDRTAELQITIGELEKAVSAANAANAAKSAFLANMSHEIRTPLNGISGSLHLMRNGLLDKSQEQYLSIASRSCEGLAEIINNILDLSKIEAGRMDLCNELFDIRKEVSKSIQIQISKAEEKNISLLMRISNDVPDMIRGDRMRICQVLVNLIGNAVKFTHHGSVRVEIDIEPRNGANCVLKCRVKDSGIGIPVEKQKILFTPFTQADISTTKKYGGTGLGLAICKELVGKMNGSIGVESEDGKGSTFWFEIPVEFTPEDTQKDRYIHFDSNKVRILLYGEDPVIIDLISRNIADWGFSYSILSANQSVKNEIVAAGQEGHPYTAILVTSESILDNPQNLADIPPGLPVGFVARGAIKPLHLKALDEKIINEIIQPLQHSNFFDTLISMLMSKRGVEKTASSAVKQLEHQQGKKIPDTRFNTARVLVAEDNETNQLIAREFFKENGIIPTIVENGKLALEAVQKEPFDLIFLDCHMPEMDGLEAARRIRSFEDESNGRMHRSLRLRQMSPLRHRNNAGLPV